MLARKTREPFAWKEMRSGGVLVLWAFFSLGPPLLTQRVGSGHDGRACLSSCLPACLPARSLASSLSPLDLSLLSRHRQANHASLFSGSGRRSFVVELIVCRAGVARVSIFSVLSPSCLAAFSISAP